MAELTPYQKLREANPKGRKRAYATEVAAERKKESTRRYVVAQQRADSVLREKYRAEWDEVFALERAGVAEERGPLPGD